MYVTQKGDFVMPQLPGPPLKIKLSPKPAKRVTSPFSLAHPNRSAPRIPPYAGIEADKERLRRKLRISKTAWKNAH